MGKYWVKWSCKQKWARLCPSGNVDMSRSMTQPNESGDWNIQEHCSHYRSLTENSVNRTAPSPLRKLIYSPVFRTPSNISHTLNGMCVFVCTKQFIILWISLEENLASWKAGMQKWASKGSASNFHTGKHGWHQGPDTCSFWDALFQ